MTSTALTTLKNMNHFGVKNPTIYPLIFKGNYGQRSFKILSAKDVKGMQNADLTYVIKTSGELIISRLVDNQKEPILHLHLADGEPVYGAGHLTVKEGKIISINGMAEGYNPNGSDLKTVISKVFSNYGFAEAKTGAIFTGDVGITPLMKMTQVIPSVAAKPLTPLEKQTAETLVTYGAPPKKVAQIFQDPVLKKKAMNAVEELRNLEHMVMLQKTHHNYIAFFNGSAAIFQGLSQVKNSTLATVGKVGAPIMTSLGNIENLWGVFSGSAGSLATVGFAGSFGPIASLTVAGIGLLDMLLNSNDNTQIQLIDSLKVVHQQLDSLRLEMHQRFNELENAIYNVAHIVEQYSRQILSNQKTLYDLQKEHIRISLQEFQRISLMVCDLRAENRGFYQHINNQFSYLIDIVEIQKLQVLKESIEKKLILLWKRSEKPVEDMSEIRIEMLGNKLINLELDIKKCSSPDYNGKKEFLKLCNDPRQSLKFMRNRLDNEDDGLGFLAEEIERITGITLSTEGVKTELLPTTSIWFNASYQYLCFSQLPLFDRLEPSDLRADLKKQEANLLKFLTYIHKSKVIPLLLEKQQKYYDAIGLILFQILAGKRRLLGEQAEPKEKLLPLGEYFPKGAEREGLDPLFDKLDYNSFLLNRFAYLGCIRADLQERITRMNQSIHLLKQTFNFQSAKKDICLIHDSMQSIHWGRGHRFPYYWEHLETFGGNVINGKTMIFLSTQGTSANQPGGAHHMLLVHHYDLESGEKITGPQVCSKKEAGWPPEPFPLLTYKGDYNTSVDHVWASTHSVIKNGKPYLVFFSGGSGFVSLYDVTAKEWISPHVNHSPVRFTVPVVQYEIFTDRKRANSPIPNTTAYSQVILDRYLLVNRVVWSTSAASHIDFHAFDLMDRHWITSAEVETLFYAKLPSLIISEPQLEQTLFPNQFFIGKFRPNGNYEALVYGILQVSGEEILASFNYLAFDESVAGNQADQKESPFSTSKCFPILAKTIYQTRSEVVSLNEENILMVIASIANKEGHPQLLFLSADFFKNHYDSIAFDLPSIHQIPDLQAMRSTVVKVAGKDQIVVTLFDPDFRMKIFCYDPKTKNITQLDDGPTLTFPPFQIGAAPRHESGQYLSKMRKEYPGYYPVRPIEVSTIQDENMSKILISYPKAHGNSCYMLELMSIPLAPLLEMQPMDDLPALLAVPTPENQLPGNHLTTNLTKTQLFASLTNVQNDNDEKKDED